MVNMQTNRSSLETESLTLLFRYSVPTTLTLMVNYIYNIVDQIFVGQGVGITGMAATTLLLGQFANAGSPLPGEMAVRYRWPVSGDVGSRKMPIRFSGRQ